MSSGERGEAPRPAAGGRFPPCANVQKNWNGDSTEVGGGEAEVSGN